MSLLAGYQHWATLGLLNDTQGQRDVRTILHDIRADFPEQLNLKSAPTYDRLRRAIARRIRDMPAHILCLHRDDAVGALYELFKLCRSDWSTGKSKDVSGGSCEDGDGNASDSLIHVEGDLGDCGGPFEELVISRGDKAFATAGHSTLISNPAPEYAGQTDSPAGGYTHADSDSGRQGPSMDVVLHDKIHVIARSETRPCRRRQKHSWDQFDYHHTNVVFNAFVDITWSRYPRCRETIRLSDMLGRITHSPSPQTPLKIHSTQGRHQTRSPDGDWIRLDAISLSQIRKQLQLIRSFDRNTDAIWWSTNPLYTTNLAGDSVAGQIRIDSQRDLIWAVFRSFDAPWQEWRGRRGTWMIPSRENCPRFSIIVRDTEDLVDTFEFMDLQDDVSASGSSGCESVGGSGGSEEPESVSSGDDLAEILTAIINEPVRSNGWA